MKTTALTATTWRSRLLNTVAIGTFVSVAIVYTACSKEVPPTTHKQATEVAQESYEALYDEKYDDFLKARLGQHDAALGVMQVFMTVTYGDQSQEEIVVPLVKVDDEWKLK